jgi:hypothetical protein
MYLPAELCDVEVVNGLTGFRRPCCRAAGLVVGASRCGRSCRRTAVQGVVAPGSHQTAGRLEPVPGRARTGAPGEARTASTITRARAELVISARVGVVRRHRCA